MDNVALVRAALAERGYQAIVVVDAALRHQLGHRDAGELERQIAAQEVIQAPAETDADQWVISIADHHGAPVVSNDRFDEYRNSFPWLSERRVAVASPCRFLGTEADATIGPLYKVVRVYDGCHHDLGPAGRSG